MLGTSSKNYRPFYMARINWLKAKTEYISNPQETLLSIAGKYKVSHTSVKNKATKEDWGRLRQETSQKVDEKLPEKLGDKIASVNARQAGLGVAFQGMAIKAIQEKDENGQPKIKPVTIDEVRLLALTGVTIERQALNLEKNNNQPIAIQINFGSPEVAEWGK